MAHCGALGSVEHRQNAVGNMQCKNSKIASRLSCLDSAAAARRFSWGRTTLTHSDVDLIGGLQWIRYATQPTSHHRTPPVCCDRTPMQLIAISHYAFAKNVGVSVGGEVNSHTSAKAVTLDAVQF